MFLAFFIVFVFVFVIVLIFVVSFAFVFGVWCLVFGVWCVVLCLSARLSACECACEYACKCVSPCQCEYALAFETLKAMGKSNAAPHHRGIYYSCTQKRQDCNRETNKTGRSFVASSKKKFLPLLSPFARKGAER